MTPIEEYLKKQETFAQVDLDAYSEHVSRMKDKGTDFSYEEMVQHRNKVAANQAKFRSFGESLKTTLVIEAVCHTFQKVGKELDFNEHHLATGAKIIENLIKENGTDVMIDRFRTKNVLLSSYAEAIEHVFNSVMEANKEKCANCNDEDDICFTFDKEYASNFVDSLVGATPTRIANIIGDRVGKAVTSFVDQNTENKLKIEDIYRKAKEKIAKTDDQEIKEEFNGMAKRAVNRINQAPTTFYGSMVREMATSIMKNEDLKKVYATEEGRLNMGKICNDTQVMYTVLETVNTLGVVDVTPEYAKRVIMDIRDN